MKTPILRVLVVDDYEPFRRLVCSTLEKFPELQVTCEVSDGLEAVRKAEQLQPDLIVIDVGLPTLNGIEAARRIRKLSPNSRILFVSQESSTDVVEEALSLGALGYVVKAHAGTELSAAVEAVSRGRQFVGRGLSGPQEALRSLVPVKSATSHHHEVKFYSEDSPFLADFTDFIEAALEAKNVVIAIATQSHLDSLLQRLQERSVDSAAAIEQGRYIPLNVDDTLSSFMVNELPDVVRFQKVVRNLIAAAAKGAQGNPPRVSACGECSPVLWAQGYVNAAVQVEHLFDEIARTYDVDMLCGYVLTSFQREHERHISERICAEHSAVRS